MALMTLLRQLIQTRSRKSGRGTRAGRRHANRYPLSLEVLEDRTVPQAVSWMSTTGGAWNVGSNWSTGVVPTSADDVTINQSNITVTLSDSEAVNSLHTSVSTSLVDETGGSLTIGGNSEIDGTLDLSGGSLTDNGQLTLTGDTEWNGGSINGSGSLINSGTLTVSGGSSLSLGENLTNSGTLTVSLGTTLDLQDNVTLSGGSLTVNGELTLGGGTEWNGGSIGGSGALSNSGTLTVSGGGDQSLGDDLTNNGTLTVSSGTTLDLQGTLDLSSGSLTVNGELTLGGDTEWNGGSIGGSGALSNSGTLTVSGGGDQSLGDDLTNSGTLTVSSGTTLDLQGTLDLSSGSLIVNGELTLAGDSEWNGGSIDGSGALTNSGTLTVSGGDQSLGEDLNNSGTLIIDSGTTLDVSGDYTQGSNGTLEVQLGGSPASGQYGQLTVDSGYSATLGGAIQAVVVNGYVASAGDDFTVVNYSTNSNTTFAVTNLPMSVGVSFQVQVNNTNVTLDGSTQAAPVVTTQPSSQTVAAGQMAIFTAAASANPAATVQWQISTDGGHTFTNISGAISTTLGVLTSAADDGNEYQAVFTNSISSTTSSAASLTVDFAPAITGNPGSQTVDAGQTATFTASDSAEPTATVQWQVSSDGGHTFTDISGATSTTLSISATAAENGDEYQAVFTNSVSSATTSAATLTVDYAPSITGNPGSQTVDAGQTATFTASDNADPAATVKWQISSDGGHTFTDISGAISTTLSISATAAENGDEYQAVFTNSVGATTTSAATLTVDYAPSITGNPGSQTVDAGQTATFTASDNADPTATVQWQISSDGGHSFSDITDATSTTLSFSATAAESGDEYQAVFTNSVGTANSSAATLTVDYAPTITTQPLSRTVDAGASVTFTAQASNGNPVPTTVQWQISTDGGHTFTNIGGATTNTLTLNTTAVTDNGNEYQAVFSNTAGLSATTLPALLSVDYAPAITTQPLSQTVDASASVTFSAAASDGNPGPATVQWQVSSDGGHTFTDISGATSTTLSLSATAAENGDEYRAVFTNSVGAATTSAATLTVDFAPSITGNPGSQTVDAGQTATFTASDSADPTATVQWQISSDGGHSFSDITDATSTTLSFSATAAESGDEYQAVFTNSVGTANSSAATLTVDYAPTITTQPLSQTVDAGASVTFTAAASNGNPMPTTVQWQISTDGGHTFTNIGSATTDTLILNAAAANNGNEYQAVFSNTAGLSATTLPALLSVDYAPTVTTQPLSQTVNSGASVTFTAHASDGNPGPTTVQWQVSTDGGHTFTNIDGATSATLTLINLLPSQNGTEYQAVFTNSIGSAASNPATLTVDFAPSITATGNPSSLTAAAGQTVTFMAAANAGNPGATTVQWQISTDGGNLFTNIPGATLTTLSFAVATAENGNEYRAVFTNSVGIAISSAATLSVIQAHTPVIISANHATLVTGTAGSFTVTTTATPTAALSEVGTLPTGVTWTDNHDGTATLAGKPAAGTGGTYHLKLVAFNGKSVSQNFILTVNQAPIVTVDPDDQVVAVGHQATFKASASANPAARVQWQVSTDGGTFTNIKGATSTTLHVAAAIAANGNEYQAVFTNSAGTATSSAAMLTVYKIPAITSANHATFRVGTASSFTVTTTGFPAAALSALNDLPADLTFTDNGNGTATISGTPAAGTGGISVVPFLAMNDFGAVTQIFTLTINQAPVILTAPSNETVHAGQKATFTASASATPGARVQWQVSTNGGASFKNIVGANSATLSLTASAALNGAEYQAVFTNSLGSVTTSAATLTVDFAPRFTSANHDTFKIGSANSFTIATAGFPVAALSEDGDLPTGLTFTDNGNGTATLSGTAAADTYHLVFVAGNDIDSVLQHFTLTVR